MRKEIKQAFSITGRETAIVIELLEGKLRRGDVVSYPTNDGAKSDFVVENVEFIDHISDKQADIGILVKGIDPTEVQIGQEITGISHE